MPAGKEFGGLTSNTGSGLGLYEIADAAFQAGFTDRQQLATMIAIALAESGGRPNANNAGLNSNGTVDFGLWQINSVHQPDLDRVYDPYYNGQLAHTVFGQQGFNAWSSYNRGRHVPHMSEAVQAATKYLEGVNFSHQGPPGKNVGPMINGDGKKVGQSILSGLARMVAEKAQQGAPGPLDGDALGDEPAVVEQDDEADVGADLNDFLTNRRAAFVETPEGEPALNEQGMIEATQELGLDNELGQQIVEAARQYLGQPYVWGGVSATGMDCSGLVLLVMNELGIPMPRVSRDQANAGVEVSIDEAGAGDLVAFDAGGAEGVVNHIGIIVGRDESGRLVMIHAPRTGDVVRIETLSDRRIGDIMAIRRVGQ